MAIISKNTFDKDRETKTRQLVDMAGALFADNDNTPSTTQVRPALRISIHSLLMSYLQVHCEEPSD